MRALLGLACDAAFAPRAVLLAPLVPAAVLVVFVLTWGDGTGATAWPAWTFYDQARFVELSALLWALPWIAQRALPVESPVDRLRLSAFTGAAPSRLVLGRALAAAVAGGVMVLCSTPVTILAQRMSGGSLVRLALDEAALLGLAAFAVAGALWIERWVASPVMAWLLGVGLLAASATAMLGVFVSSVVIALASAGLAAVALVALLHVVDRDAARTGGAVS